ncbi:11783_t:CDS:2 [Gigaspora margarita]|uniref:11783_t:CDS:1 n=1 Tax=Gigaspora margarita TaxID=4874 RepID=A0ABM8W2W3_GIGMA|nr:11783_t:CDS:2 [Gigaspora margarita]
MEVSREKKKKATAERMEIETNPITIVKIAIKNERSKQILDDSWSLPISKKLTRITQEENEKEEDIYKAINIKINYSNTFFFWRDISEVERPDRRSTSAAKWNQRNLSPDSNKGKKVVNGFSKNASKLNQKNTLYEKKITRSHNKENESGETTKYKNYYNEDKKKEGHNVERSSYIEKYLERDRGPQSLLTVAKSKQKNQLAVEDWLPLQRSQIQNIQPKQREGEEALREKEEEGVLKSKGKKKARAEDQEENKENREVLKKGILETAMKHIPKKKICKTRVARDGKKRPRLDKLIIELGRWIRKDKRKIGRDMTEEDRKNFGLFRENIRKKF